MTNSKKHTKRALLSSALSLLLCITMLIGTTWAWFTDSVTSAGNIIKSGTLDVEMSWADGKENPDSATWKDASTGAIFDYALWEPGYVQVRHVKIANVGTLAFKYQIAIKANGELETNANGRTLADAIDVYYLENAAQITDRTALNGVEPECTLAQFLAANADPATNTATGKLYPKDNTDGKPDNHTVTIALKMREDAGNEYQDMSIGTDFSVQLLATQWTYEEDTFNDQYDVNADETPDNEGWSYENVSTKVVENAANPFEITSDIATVSVPANALAAGDKFELAMDNFDIDNSAQPAIAISFDLMLRRNGVAVKEETDGVEYTVSLQLEKKLTINSVTHNGEAVTGYTYDADTGIMTLTVKHFSPFVIKAERKSIQPANEEQLIEVLDTYLESDSEEPLEIKLSDDFEYTETPLKVESGKDVTIDLNGHDLTIGNDTSDGLVVEGGGTLTLTNSGEDGAYTFNTNDTSNDSIYVYNDKEEEVTTLNFENVEINVDSSQWIAIHAYADKGKSVININEGTTINVIGEESQIAGILVDGGGEVNFNGGVINVMVNGGANGIDYTKDSVGIVVGNGQNGIRENPVLNMKGGTINVIGKGTFAQAIQTADVGDNIVNMTGGTINVTGKGVAAFGIAKKANVNVTGGEINIDVDEGYEGYGFVFQYPYTSYGSVNVKSSIVNLVNDNRDFLTDTSARVNITD